MSKKGVSKISGNPAPKVGENTLYTIDSWYSTTPQDQKNPARVTWELFKKRSDGRFTSTNIKKVGDSNFTFGEVAHKHTYRLEAYLHEPEGSGPTTIDINPQPAGIPKINKVELHYVDDSRGTVFSYTEKLVAKAQCVNLSGEKLLFILWEDDAAGNGHNSNNLFVDSKQATVERNGMATAEFVLTKALMQKAANGEINPKELQFYVTVEYYQNRKHATQNVEVQNPDFKVPKAADSPAAQKPESKKEEKGIIDKATESVKNKLGELWDWFESSGTIKPEQQPTVQKPEGKSTSVVNEEKIEGLLDAYFAKEEFKIETSETDGQHTYSFGSNNNNIDKDKIAGIIKPKVDALVKKDKKYAKLDDIKNALTKTSYAKGETISFALYKLGPEMVKISNAPLEEEVFIVARTYLLDGKEVNIRIKEKETILVAQNGDLPVLEAKENGNEITVLKAVVQNNMAKVKVKLRPKSDDTLKEWKEKLKGVKDGTHSYTFGGNGNNTATPEQKKKIAGIIIGKIKAELATQKKFAKTETIEAALTQQVYNKDEKVTFDVYKSVTEYLWLKAEAQGNIKKHEGEFLKQDGAYFEIGKKCPRCTEKITLEQIEELFGVLPNYKAFRQEIVDNLNKYIFESGKDIHINTCLRKAHFFAQVGAETSGINPDWMVESDAIPYGASNITEGLFGERAKKLRDMGKTSEYASERPQKKLLSFLYAKENGFGNGNGDEASGDGYTFRGRGLKQLTGRGNYKEASGYLKEIFPDEYVDLEANPDKVKEAKYAVLSAIAYWEKGEIWKTADTIKVSSDDNVKKIRRLVNGGTAGWKDAKKFFEKGLTVFKVNECQPVESNSGKWHDPVDNPRRPKYNSSGNIKPVSGAYGDVRNGYTKYHSGLDLFGLPFITDETEGTPVYACLDGQVVESTPGNTAGQTIRIKIDNVNELLEQEKLINYQLEFARGEEMGIDIKDTDDVYFIYMHLSKRLVENGPVTAGTLIGYSGVSGSIANNIPSPHLHLEIATVQNAFNTGKTKRTNPARFIRLNSYDTPDQDDAVTYKYNQNGTKTSWNPPKEDQRNL